MRIIVRRSLSLSTASVYFPNLLRNARSTSLPWHLPRRSSASSANATVGVLRLEHVQLRPAVPPRGPELRDKRQHRESEPRGERPRLLSGEERIEARDDAAAARGEESDERRLCGADASSHVRVSSASPDDLRRSQSLGRSVSVLPKNTSRICSGDLKKSPKLHIAAAATFPGLTSRDGPPVKSSPM